MLRGPRPSVVRFQPFPHEGALASARTAGRSTLLPVVGGFPALPGLASEQRGGLLLCVKHCASPWDTTFVLGSQSPEGRDTRKIAH